ncbi:MAG: hypothetical protein WC346_09710 [Methanogenium sp.]|jgi:hypothetical protein
MEAIEYINIIAGGDATTALTIESVGTAAFLLVLSICALKLVFYALRFFERVDKQDDVRRRNAIYLDTIYTQYKVAIVKQAATTEGVVLEDIPETPAKTVAQTIREQVQNEIAPKQF